MIDWYSPIENVDGLHAECLGKSADYPAYHAVKVGLEVYLYDHLGNAKNERYLSIRNKVEKEYVAVLLGQGMIGSYHPTLEKLREVLVYERNEKDYIGYAVREKGGEWEFHPD